MVCIKIITLTIPLTDKIFLSLTHGYIYKSKQQSKRTNIIFLGLKPSIHISTAYAISFNLAVEFFMPA